MTIDDTLRGRSGARRRTPARAIIFTGLAAMAISIGGAGIAVAAPPAPPAATTTAATNVTSASATLNGIVTPNKNATTYYFQYGTSNAPYANRTPAQGPVNGNAGKAASTTVTGLASSTTYHFRVVANNSAGAATGSDLTFTTSASGGGTPPSAVTISARPDPITYGGATTIAGQLSGPRSAGGKVTLEANPYPYTSGFTPTGATTTTNATGTYSFVVTPPVSTRYLVTLKNPSLTSQQTAVTVRVRVGFRVSTRNPTFGQLVRFFGTVTPAHNNRIALIQRRTNTGGWTTVASATLFAAAPVNGIATSKFSKQLRLSHNGTYRVSVNPKDGNHATGTSSQTGITVHVRVTLRLGTLTPVAGQLVRFSGTVIPAHNGRVAQIQRRTNTGGWTTVASATLFAAAPVNGIATSKFSRLVRINHNGTYRVQVNPRDRDHGVGNSPTRTVRVH
ncbi:MAG: hypothetical protein ACYC91_00135 [Solirubrobacteraceae bacterium]